MSILRFIPFLTLLQGKNPPGIFINDRYDQELEPLDITVTLVDGLYQATIPNWESNKTYIVLQRVSDWTNWKGQVRLVAIIWNNMG
jgi:hypothetical protein